MPEKHNLSRNPFDEGRFDHEMVGRQSEMQRLFRLVEEAATQQNSAIVPILGPYGMGKTFTLLNLRSQFRKRSAPFKDRKIFGVYLTATRERFPSKYPVYIFNNVVEDMGERGIRSLAKEVPSDPKSMLQSLQEPDFRNAMRFLSNDENPSIIWNWLRGGSIPAKKAAEMSISGKISGDEQAKRMLLDLCRLLKKLEYDSFILLIDELEQAYAQGEAYTKVIVWVKQWFDQINRTMSESPDSVVPAITMIGCAPETWSAITAGADKGRGRGAYGQVQAFLERIPRENIVELAPLDSDEVKLLLEKFLESATKRKRPSPLYPFDNDSAKIVFDTSQGVPRMVIRLARILLREADRENKPVNKDNADRWLRLARIAVD
jgi:hypothetical protein